jgi:hypothetical protein
MALFGESMELIYCAGGNKEFAQIAIDSGFLFGSKLPSTIYHDIYFADQNWKKPNIDKYIRELNKYKPKVATVLDLEYVEQLDEVMIWADKVSAIVDTVIIIPKVSGVIGNIPRTINGSKIRLGYSVPTKYGGTTVDIKEFDGWPVHLLGGSPHQQMKLFNEMNVESVDGNMHKKIALNFIKFWEKKNSGAGGTWKRLDDFSGREKVLKTFERSCINIFEAWSSITVVNGQTDL